MFVLDLDRDRPGITLQQPVPPIAATDIGGLQRDLLQTCFLFVFRNKVPKACN
jgi:hypothetical protein